MSLKIASQQLRVDVAAKTAQLTGEGIQARELLHKLAVDLVDQNGRIKSGYLKLSVSGEHAVLKSDHRSKGATAATDLLRQLVEQAYGDAASQALNQYLGSGNKIGSRSFVKLIKALEPRQPGAPLTDLDRRLQAARGLKRAGLDTQELVSQVAQSAVFAPRPAAQLLGEVGAMIVQAEWPPDLAAMGALSQEVRHCLNTQDLPPETAQALQMQLHLLLIKSVAQQSWASDEVDNDAALAQLGSQVERLQQLLSEPQALTGEVRHRAADLLLLLRTEQLERMRPDFERVYMGEPNANELLGQTLHARFLTGIIDAEHERRLQQAAPSAPERTAIRAKEAELVQAMDRLRPRLSSDSAQAQALWQDLSARRKAVGSETIKAALTGSPQASRNWDQADAYVNALVRAGRKLAWTDLQAINRLLSEGLPSDHGIAGDYRTVAEMAAGIGRRYPTPAHLPEMTEDLMQWYEENAETLPALELAGLFARRLVSIHPFPDANGRTARLAADAILQSRGLPPALYTEDDALLAVFVDEQNPSPAESVDRIARGVQASLDHLAGAEGLKSGSV